MALSSSPRKLVVPLASGDEPRSRTSTSTPLVTRRAFYCGVVVEGSENGRRLPEEIQDLVLSLGNPLPSESSEEILATQSNQSLVDIDRAAQRKRALLDPSALSSVINELLTSERTYVKRLQSLKVDYADPLRNFARNKDTAIIPAYEAKTLFGNIDVLLPVNEAFLTDLELMLAPNGHLSVGGVGDVCLRHFKELRGFEQYKQYYVKREDAQAIFEKEISKRSSRFASYIDHIKYQSIDSRNRVGLRELLMEPVQRIPRYTLMFRTMLKHMSPDDPQRAKIIEADEIASKIAQAEADEQTKRAAIFYCLIATIEGFPPDLFSNSRKFIDCIDVEDIITDTQLSSSTTGGGISITSLHCTLFLFDDKLVIVKRPGNGEKGGRTLSGLDAVEKVTKAGGIPTGKKKSGMTCKGVFDIMDIAATDIGGSEIHLFLENPPQDQTERWTGRPFRSLSVVIPPAPINLDPTQTENEKQRFLENLWRTQAIYRARAGQSVVLCSDEQEVESRSGRTTFARTYFNVYQRTAFLQETKKCKVVVHIDRDRHASADPIPFGQGGPPFVVIRVQLMDGGLCRYSVTSSEPNDDGEEDIVQTSRVPARVVHTIHQFGLFEFKTGKNSLPSTPTAKSKVAIFGLDAISRNLFNGRPPSVGDFFAGSISGHRRHRSRSTTSRSSAYTHTTTTMDSMKSSHRSTTTAATTISSMEDDYYASRSSKSTKLSRQISAGDSDSETPMYRRSGSMSRPHSRSSTRGTEIEYSDVEDDDATLLAQSKEIGTSDHQLALQLELARQNSLAQYGNHPVPLQMDGSVESIIYEEEPPYPLRKMREGSTLPLPESPPKRRESPPRTSRPLSIHTSERRPTGPRSPSPLPPRSPQPTQEDLPTMEDDIYTDSNIRHENVSEQTATPGIKRSQRQSFFPADNTESTPKAASTSTITAATPIEPLSIKKKTSVRSDMSNSPTPVRKAHTRSMQRVVSPRKVSPQIRKPKAGPSNLYKSEDLDKMLQRSVTSKEDIEASRRSLKRLKTQIEVIKSTLKTPGEDASSRPSSPDKGLRLPQLQTNVPMTKAAQERLEEMRNLIGRRQGEGVGTPRSRPRSGTLDTPSRMSAASDTGNLVKAIELLAMEMEKDLTRAYSNQEALQADLSRLTAEYKERIIELERSRLELQHSRRQCELVKSLLADATAEKEIMYEAFNEELDGMYNDANLPENEALHALARDLQQTKEVKNNLSRENSALKRKLAETELEKEEWGELLRAHGLIS
ncbi:Rho guanine nucleotide exchange factor gef2 [Psilocybe cubensis]|uniref:DH domain-containing protein n=2 Tax=Psilocybe cubensis TaxID=181762 RepID=A0A8H8CJU4_PSICU|nr:Rho guanine nucleotide exchange factor gef2 [Psilocybe cubensis]KAH9482553.1 Rho guanine nucleotide exchange factor gef2 [Psilocybe cubensis]